MKKKNILQVFAAYLYHYRMTILFILVITAVYALIFYLYHIPSDIVFYALRLCMLPLLFFVPIHFAGYYGRYRRLFELMGQYELPGSFVPAGKNLIEKSYVNLIEEWVKRTKKEKSRLRMFKDESMDYYRIWVHQIKTPIAVMRLLLQEEDTEENNRLLLELSKIEEYVEMVLSYFRLEGDGNDLVIREYELDDIIRGCIRKYAPWFVAKDIRLCYEGCSERVLTDKKQLACLLEQFLSNAAKYTDKKGCVTVSVKEERIEIRDTGIGIAPEDLPRIFEQGFTGYNGRAGKKSTGIGLYLAKRTAALLGYSLSVTSAPGAGSCFCIDMKKRQIEVE